MLINPSMLGAEIDDDDAINETLDLFEPGFDPRRADFVGPLQERDIEIDAYGNLWICHGYTKKPLRSWPMPRSILTCQNRPRRALHRAFLRWLRQNSMRFAVPLSIDRRTDTAIEFSFRGVNPTIKGAVVCDGISAYVEWRDKLWDFFVDFDAAPRRQSTRAVHDDVLRFRGRHCKTPNRLGFYCMLCKPDARTVYASRYALWRNEVFEPFLEWVNSDLAHAQRLGIHGRWGSSWAELLRDES